MLIASGRLALIALSSAYLAPTKELVGWLALAMVNPTTAFAPALWSAREHASRCRSNRHYIIYQQYT